MDGWDWIGLDWMDGYPILLWHQQHRFRTMLIRGANSHQELLQNSDFSSIQICKEAKDIHRSYKEQSGQSMSQKCGQYRFMHQCSVKLPMVYRNWQDHTYSNCNSLTHECILKQWFDHAGLHQILFAQVVRQRQPLEQRRGEHCRRKDSRNVEERLL